MKLLVLVQNYPTKDNPYAMSYVHSRNIIYIENNYHVDVLSFSAHEYYNYEGINIFPERSINFENYDVIISHAPNLKNHYRVLRKLHSKKIFFIFHGHEVLKGYLDYPTPYSWIKQSFVKSKIQQYYQFFKLKILKNWLTGQFSQKNTLGMIFVSEWMREKFIKNLGFEPESYSKTVVIPNAVNNVFVNKTYSPKSENLLADCVTIRPFDESKYALDLVLELAKLNPNKTFHIYGKGRYFYYNQCPENVKVFDRFIEQKDIADLLNCYRCAVMPTRFDSQGVMMCEMATFGIPLITTNFSVCLEMLNEFDNVKFFDLNRFAQDIGEIGKGHTVNKIKFNPYRLIDEELKFFHGL